MKSQGDVRGRLLVNGWTAVAGVWTRLAPELFQFETGLNPNFRSAFRSALNRTGDKAKESTQVESRSHR